VTARLASVGLTLFCGLVLTACEAPPARPIPAPPSVKSHTTPAIPPTAASGGWRSVATGEGNGLTYADDSGRPVITLVCGGGDLRVRVPGFRKIGSEDRLTVGAGDEAFALVADLASAEPGVVATGDIPADLIDRMARGQPVAAVYGAQRLDPLPIPDAETSRALVSACRAR